MEIASLSIAVDTCAVAATTTHEDDDERRQRQTATVSIAAAHAHNHDYHPFRLWLTWRSRHSIGDMHGRGRRMWSQQRTVVICAGTPWTDPAQPPNFNILVKTVYITKPRFFVFLQTGPTRCWRSYSHLINNIHKIVFRLDKHTFEMALQTDWYHESRNFQAGG